MTMGGISSSLNSTLARLSMIESNFQALNNIAFEIDLKQNSNVNEASKSDFKTILDNKIKDSAETNNISKNMDLPVYDDEIEQVKPEKEIEIKPTEKQTEVQEENFEQLGENKQQEKVQEIKETDETENIKTQKITLKDKIKKKPKEVNIDKIIETFSNKYEVDSDFIKAIIKQESGFNPNATSKKGAMGLMQLMPLTAKSLGVVDAYNPEENIEGGVKLIKGLLNKYSNNLELALAAYNAGEGAVKKYGGIPPYKETQNYVKSIMGAYNRVREDKI